MMDDPEIDFTLCMQLVMLIVLMITTHNNVPEPHKYILLVLMYMLLVEVIKNICYLKM